MRSDVYPRKDPLVSSILAPNMSTNKKAIQDDACSIISSDWEGELPHRPGKVAGEYRPLVRLSSSSSSFFSSKRCNRSRCIDRRKGRGSSVDPIMAKLVRGDAVRSSLSRCVP